MKILCLGNNHLDTDELTTKLGKNLGLITDINIHLSDGYYHTSVLDLSDSEILELADRFDKVIVLDQPVEQWNHPNEFTHTQNIARRIQVRGIDVIWTNSTGIDQLNYWQNLVETNKSFCIFPFIELLTMNGYTTVCCRSDTPIRAIAQLDDFATDTEYQKIRQSMLKGESIPKHCKACYKLEDKKILSARQEETVEWAMRLGLKTVDDLTKIKEPVYYEVRPSNTCNIMCRMCSPKYSSLIEKEQKSLGNIPEDYTEQFSNFDIVNVPNIVKLYVAGGEPTAMPDFYEFLRKCIKQNHTEFEFYVNTNAVKVSTLLLELGRHFKNLQFIVSIDGFEQANDYTRWRSKWSTVIKNIHKLQKNGHTIHFNTTLSLYTIFGYHRLIRFLDQNFPGCLVHGQYGEGYSPFVFDYPQQLINDLKSIYDTKIYKNNQLFKSFIDGTITSATESSINQESIKKFFIYNDMLDQARSSKLIDYIPALEDLRVCLDKH